MNPSPTLNPSPEMPWQAELARSFRSAESLLEQGFIQANELPAYRILLAKYKFLLPRYYANLIDKNDPLCPIRRQAIPSLEESRKEESYLSDPLADMAHRPEPHVTHRYPNRALLHLTPNCSMYCRFCFRKSLLNELGPEFFKGSVEKAFEYFALHPEIEEVILSGGDPLMSSDVALGWALDRLRQIPTIQRIRIHSRVPVTFPSRINESLINRLKGGRTPLVLVAHFNHPKEITEEVRSAASRLKEAGLILLNQTVLLGGVNDSAATLGELSRALFSIGFLPYYLHHPDRSEGTAHFDVSLEAGLKIYETLRRELSGYLVPRYVRDVVGHPYKVSVAELD